MRTYQVRMIPTPVQKKELKRCFSAARKAYNWTVSRINTNGMASFYNLRNEYRNLQYDDDIKPEWTNVVHNKFVMNAVKHVHSAASSAFTNIARGNINHFDLHYRSHKKTKSEVLEVEGGPNGRSAS